MSRIIPITIIILVLFAGIFIGGFFKLHYSVIYFDDALHLVGSFALAWLLLSLLGHHMNQLPKYISVLLVLGTVILFGVTWEILEYLSGAYLENTVPLIYNYFRGGDLKDTIGDLTIDIIGSLLFLIPFFVFPKR